MTTAGWTALAITIFGAFSYGAGSILQAVGARRSTGTVRTLGHPLYLIGVGCDLLAWAGSMIALRELAVYLVQSVLAGSLAVTVVAARIFLASRLRGRDVAAVVITIGALTVLAMSAGPEQHMTPSSGLRFAFCAAALATALIGWGATKVAPPGIVALLAGLSLGAAALAGRALTLPAQPMENMSGAALAIFTEPLTGALVVFAATGMLLYTNALQCGQVGPVTAVLWIGEVIAPSAIALTFLGDTVRPGWELAAAVAGVITIGAALMLATAPATGATAQPADAHAIEAARPAALPAGRQPVGQPLHDRYFGKILWWGQPSIWTPPARTPAAVTSSPVAALTWDPPDRGRAPWAVPRRPDTDRTEVPRPGTSSAERWPARPSWAYPAEPEYQPVEAQPADDGDAGTFLWSERPPIWRPPDRTRAKPAWSHPYRTEPTWTESPTTVDPWESER
jgi:hypothetical protein